VLDAPAGALAGQFAGGGYASATHDGAVYKFGVSYADDAVTLALLPTGTVFVVR
jgi:hypothetical protein